MCRRLVLILRPVRGISLRLDSCVLVLSGVEEYDSAYGPAFPWCVLIGEGKGGHSVGHSIYKFPLIPFVLGAAGAVFSIFFALNLLIWGEKSSGAVPFGTLFALCFLWFGISVPLVFVGSYFGYKKPAPEDPVR